MNTCHNHSILHESETLMFVNSVRNVSQVHNQPKQNMLTLMKVKFVCLTLREEGTLLLKNVRNQTTHTMTQCNLNPHSAVITRSLKYNLNWHLKPRANCTSIPSPSFCIKWYKLAVHPVEFVVASAHVIKENFCKNCHNYRNKICYLLPHNKLQYKENVKMVVIQKVYDQSVQYSLSTDHITFDMLLQELCAFNWKKTML